MRPPKIYRIGDTAKLLGVSKRTIFRYEKSGAFPQPGRNPINGWRQYTKKDIDMLKKFMGR